MAKVTVNFGRVPQGLSFQFKGDRRNWYITPDRSQVYTFAADEETKEYKPAPAFGDDVEVTDSDKENS